MRKQIVALLGLLLVPAASAAQLPSWYPARNQVAPSVQLGSVEIEPASGEFVYRYSVANGTAAAQRISTVYLDLGVPPTGGAAPADWEFVFDPSATTVAWMAFGTIDPAWTEAHELDAPSFLSEIAPGSSRNGFLLRSSCASSGPVTYYVRGYNHTPVPPHDTATDEVAAVPGWREDAVTGTVAGPGDCDVVRTWGNRRPAVDGFLGVVNLGEGDLVAAGPLTVQLRFSRSGEQVSRSTFRAELNGADVSSLFRANPRGDLVAVFPAGHAAVAAGRNVLLTSVDGIVPGTARTATDADRLVFTVQ